MEILHTGKTRKLLQMISKVLKADPMGSKNEIIRRTMRGMKISYKNTKSCIMFLSKMNEKEVIYKKKIEMYEKICEHRKANMKFELYRANFYRKLTDKLKFEYEVSEQEIENFLTKMWKKENGEGQTIIVSTCLVLYLRLTKELVSCHLWNLKNWSDFYQIGKLQDAMEYINFS